MRNKNRLERALQRAGFLWVRKNSIPIDEHSVDGLKKVYLRICLHAENLGWLNVHPQYDIKNYEFEFPKDKELSREKRVAPVIRFNWPKS